MLLIIFTITQSNQHIYLIYLVPITQKYIPSPIYTQTKQIIRILPPRRLDAAILTTLTTLTTTIMHDHLHFHQRSAAQNSSRNALQVQESKKKKWRTKCPSTGWLYAECAASCTRTALSDAASWAGDTPSKHTPTPTHTSSHTHWRKRGSARCVCVCVSVCRCFCRDELKTGGGVG